MDLQTLKDSDLIAKLTHTIETMVTSGQYLKVDETRMKEIKKICRISDVYVTEVFKILMHQLNQKHSEIRLATLNIMKDLFKRSHTFRDLLASDFQEFSKLVFDIDPKAPLPPPAAALKMLKVTAMKTVKDWYEVYGEAYKKLKIGFLYLKNSKVVDFEDFEARTLQERLRSEEREAKLNLIKHEKLNGIRQEISDEETEILECVAQLKNGFELLLNDDFKLTKESVDSQEHKNSTTSSDLRVHGLTNPQFSLLIEVQPFQIKVTRDNKEIIQCIQDQYRLLLNRFLPLVFKWNISAAKLGAEEPLQKKILDLKSEVELVVERYQKLNLPSCKLETSLENSSDSESDLETVPDVENYEDESLSYAELFGNDVSDPEQLPGPSRIPSRNVKRRIKQTEQKCLPSDIDSYATMQSSLQLPTFSINPIESYWVQDPESVSASTGTASLVTNPVELSETFRPVKWTCRAPLQSGKLCPRSDRVKCPLHGLIVARDEQGTPLDPSSVRPLKKPTVPDWQEPSLLAEIKAATGVDLTMPTKGKRLKKQYPNLTDLKAIENTSRARLEKKVFKRTTLKKVAEKLAKKEG